MSISREFRNRNSRESHRFSHFLTFFDIFSWKCHIFPHLFNREIHFSCYSPGKFPHLPWFCTHIIVTFAHICSHFLTFFDIFWHFWHCTHIHLPANVIWYRPPRGQKRMRRRRRSTLRCLMACVLWWVDVSSAHRRNWRERCCCNTWKRRGASEKWKGFWI